MDFWRQLDILPPEMTEKTKILIVGCGGVGSSTAVTLAKMGFKNITVIDFDTVEVHNIPIQFFKLEDIGKTKTESIKEICKDLTGIEIVAVHKKIEKPEDIKELLTSPTIIISAVDTMKARKVIFEACKYNFNAMSLIDCRTRYPFLLIYNVNPRSTDEIKQYEKTLFSDEEADDGACTAQATFYTSLLSASLIGRTVQSIIKDDEDTIKGIKMCLNPIEIFIDY